MVTAADLPPEGVNSGSGGPVDPADGNRPVVLVVPPVLYRDLGNGRFAPGFWDWSFHVFYQFRGITLDAKDTPPWNPHYFHGRDRPDTAGKIIEIPLPSEADAGNRPWHAKVR